jgi:uncharacterized protein (TIGR00251 family)
VIRDTPDGVEVDVRVVPRARKTEAAGLRDGLFVLRLAAPPVEGRANDALVAWFADALDVPRRAVQLLSGATSRTKRIRIAGRASSHITALVE